MILSCNILFDLYFLFSLKRVPLSVEEDKVKIGESEDKLNEIWVTKANN